MKYFKLEILSGFRTHFCLFLLTGLRQRTCWGMTGYKYTEELCSSMQISIKGSLGQRLISLNLIFHAISVAVEILTLMINYSSEIS
jgi:hypothetical protein